MYNDTGSVRLAGDANIDVAYQLYLFLVHGKAINFQFYYPVFSPVF